MPDHRLSAETAGEARRGFGPGFLLALGAGVGRLVALFLDGGKWHVVACKALWTRRLPAQRKARGQQLLGGHIKRAARHNGVGQTLAGHLAGVVQRDRLQPDATHLARPLPVMVAAPARLARVRLPQMAHFMHKRAQNLLVAAPGEVVGVERDLVGAQGAVGAGGEALGREVAAGGPAALEGDQARRQVAGEQMRIEVVVGILVGVVFSGRAGHTTVPLQVFVSYAQFLVTHEIGT